MPKSVVNPVYEQSAAQAYAKGGFAPRRKGQHRDSYDLLPDFLNQQGQPCEFSNAGVSPVVMVEFLGTFLGYGTHGEELTYRAHKVTLANGLRVPAYSRNSDQYVICLHTGFKAY